MYPFLAVITALMLFPLSLNAVEENVKQEKARQTPRLLNDILPDLTQIINTAENTRFSNKKLTIQQKYDILRKLVTSLNPFMDLKLVKPFYPTKKKSKTFPLKKLKQGKVFYFRIDSFDSENIKPFMDNTQGIINNKKSPGGIIIDLRNCSGFEHENMYKVLQRAKALKLTIICLIGKKTKGAAELLTQMITRSPKCISMGAPTAGQPFEHKYIDLKSGFYLFIPQIPDFLKKLPEKTVNPTIPYKDKEDCLNVASDLLSVVNIH